MQHRQPERVKATGPRPGPQNPRPHKTAARNSSQHRTTRLFWD